MQSPDVPPDERLKARVRLRTRWSDEDNQAVLNNAVYLTLFEEARHRYFEQLGLLEDNRFPFVLAQTNVRFLAPGSGGAEVEIALATTHLGTRSFTQAYRVRALADGGVWCEAEALLVAWDPERRASRPMDPHFRAAVAALENLI